MTKESEHGESSHGAFVCASPAAVGILGFFEPAEGFHHGFLALFVAAVGIKASEAIFEAAAFFHGLRDVSKPAATFSLAAAPAIAEVIAISKVR